MTNIFLDNINTPPMRGFNRYERDWYFDRFQSQQKSILAIKDFAERIAKDTGKKLPDVLAIAIKAESQDAEAMAELAPWLAELSKISDDSERESKHSERDLATMLLVSRLPIRWVLENQGDLENDYQVELPRSTEDESPPIEGEADAVDYDHLLETLANSRKLQSKALWSVMASITDVLPSACIKEISNYALVEFNDGRPLVNATEEESLEEKVGKPQSESETASEESNS